MCIIVSVFDDHVDFFKVLDDYSIIVSVLDVHVYNCVGFG